MVKQTLNNGDTLLVQRTKINENITYVESLANDAQSDANDALTAASTAQGTANAAIPSSQKGVANGVASLDGTGKVPSAQLPAYVDDVLEFANFAALPTVGDTGKIYVTLDSNYEYRWSGSTYIRLVASPGSSDAVPEGSTNLYFTVARVLATILTGFSTASSAVVSVTDTVLTALGKLQAQISANVTAIANKVNKTDFVTLAYASTINWDTSNEEFPEAKTTATASFILNISNLKSGANATYKITTGTSSAVIVGFTGTGLSFKLGNVALLSYTLPAGTGKDYYIQLINDNGIVEVLINDYTTPASQIIKTAQATTSGTAISLAANTFQSMVFTTENRDTANLIDIPTSPTSFNIPGSGVQALLCSAKVAFSTGTGRRVITVAVDGSVLSQYQGSEDNVTGVVEMVWSETVYANAGSAVTIQVFSTVAVTYTGNASVTILGALS